MPGGYAEFKSSPKSLVTSDQIGTGQVQLRHLDPGLFAEIRKISTHAHKGAGSRQINIADLFGAFLKQGFYMYSSDGTKKYNVTIDSATDAFVITQI